MPARKQDKHSAGSRKETKTEKKISCLLCPQRNSSVKLEIWWKNNQFVGVLETSQSFMEMKRNKKKKNYAGTKVTTKKRLFNFL